MFYLLLMCCRCLSVTTRISISVSFYFIEIFVQNNISLKHNMSPSQSNCVERLTEGTECTTEERCFGQIITGRWLGNFFLLHTVHGGEFKSSFASTGIQQVIYAYDWCGLPFSFSCCLCLIINTNLVSCHDWGISGISEWQMPSWQVHSTATGAKSPVCKNGTCWQQWKGIIVYHVLLGYLILCFEERFWIGDLGLLLQLITCQLPSLLEPAFLHQHWW